MRRRLGLAAICRLLITSFCLVYQRYRSILDVRSLRGLLISSVIGRLPLGTCSLSVLLLVRAVTHDYAAAGLAVGALAGAQAVVAPVIGGWLDRFGAIRIIALGAGIQSVALAAMAVAAGGHPAVGPLILLSAVAGLSMPPVAAASRALWPRLLPDRADRDAAFSLDAIGQELVWTTGPVVVAIIATTVSARLAVLGVAGLTILSSAWFIHAVAALGSDARGSGVVGMTSRPARITRTLTPVIALMGMGLGGTEVTLPALASHLGHASLSGVLLGLWSIGSMGGGILFGSREWTASRERLLPWMLLSSGLLVVPLIFSNAVLPAAVASLFAGVCIAPVFSCVSSLIGEHAPSDAIARAFNWNTAAIVAGAAIGSAVDGALVSSSGVQVAFTVAGAFAIAGGLAALSLSVSTPQAELPAY